MALKCESVRGTVFCLIPTVLWTCRSKQTVSQGGRSSILHVVHTTTTTAAAAAAAAATTSTTTTTTNVHLSCAHQRPERSHDTY